VCDGARPAADACLCAVASPFHATLGAEPAGQSVSRPWERRPEPALHHAQCEFFRRFHEGRGDLRVSLSRWRRLPGVGTLRELQFVSQLKGRLGPPRAHCHQAQRCSVFGGGGHLVLETTQSARPARGARPPTRVSRHRRASLGDLAAAHHTPAGWELVRAACCPKDCRPGGRLGTAAAVGCTAARGLEAAPPAPRAAACSEPAALTALGGKRACGRG